MKTTYYQIPDSECERMTRTEMNAMKWILGALSCVAYGEEDLPHRLDLIPNGKRRYRLMRGQFRAICNDLLGVSSDNQRKSVKNFMKDMDLRFTPKMTPDTDRFIVRKDDAKYLIRAAKREKCTACTATDMEARQCELYKLLERVVPLDDYGDGSLCPYMLEDFEE